MQENKSMIESVRDYFLECPILKDGHLYIDYLNEKPTDYSIDPLVCSPIVKSIVTAVRCADINSLLCPARYIRKAKSKTCRTVDFMKGWLNG